MITSLPELYFRFKRFILLVKTKKVVPINYGSTASCSKPWIWVRLNLILTMRDIYINSSLILLIKIASSNRNTEFKDILPWDISQMITKTILISSRIVISFAMKLGIPSLLIGKLMENGMTAWSEFRNGGEGIVEEILASEEINQSKRPGLWEAKSGIRVGKLIILVRLFEI